MTLVLHLSILNAVSVVPVAVRWKDFQIKKYCYFFLEVKNLKNQIAALQSSRKLRMKLQAISLCATPIF